jgi:hypothetical protein
MDKESQENLQRILLLEQHLLTDSDIKFLRARRTYLSKVQRRDYAEFLGEEEPSEPNQPNKAQVKQQGNPNQNKAQTEYKDKDTRINLDKKEEEVDSEDSPEGDQKQEEQVDPNAKQPGEEEQHNLDPDYQPTQ